MTIETALVRARAGDGEAFRELTEPYRRELHLHCYRILGSVQDAEDVLQETLLAAWRGLEGFEGRASVRAWLYRIATNRCLNALRSSGRRPRTAASASLPEPTRRAEPVWFEPYPDALLTDLPAEEPGPEARYESREATALAFVAGLQRLPPRQRAVLVLRDVLGFRAAEVAGLVDATEVAVNSALVRARSALAAEVTDRPLELRPLPGSARERELVERFVDAFENADVERLVELLTDDAWLTMPPEPLEYQGRAAIGRFFHAYRERGWGGSTVRLVPTRANGQPAFGYYVRDAVSRVVRANGLVVLTLRQDGICAVTRFGDNSLLPPFGLPRTLPD